MAMNNEKTAASWLRLRESFRQSHAKLIRNLVQIHSGFLCLSDKEFDLIGFAFTRFAFFRRKYIFLFSFQFGDFFFNSGDFVIEFSDSRCFLVFQFQDGIFQFFNLNI